MDSEMAEDVKTEVAGEEEHLQAEDSEMAEAGKEGETAPEKTEEELEEELKETKITIPRYAPHTMPDWKLEDMRNRWPWHVRIYPIDQEDCRNCILDTVTKISQEAWYYVPKRKNGEGIAELCMMSAAEAKTVMARLIRMPFYHNFVTIEVNFKKGEENADGTTSYKEVQETASIVFDSTKCEKLKNTASSKGGVKRRTLWVRYLSEETTPELLRVVFPFAQTTQVHTQNNLRIGEVKTNSKVEVMLFVKGYLTVIMNNTHVLALQNKEMADDEEVVKTDLDKTVAPLDTLEPAPTTVAERSEQRKDDKNLSARILKRTFHQQQKMIDAKRKDPMRNRSGEPPAKRGGRGNWGDRFDGRRQGGGPGGGGRYGGYQGPPGGYGGGPHGPPGYGPGMMNHHDMAHEMMMMQAHLNHTIQNQLMRLNPNGGGGGYGGRKDGRRGGGGGSGGGGGRGGNRGGGGRRW